MQITGCLFLVAATAGSALGQAVKGFNYGAQGMTQETFQAAFEKAAELQNAPGFNSARLYTMIQDGTANTPSSAIPAAIATKTRLLLGMWCSAGQEVVTNELVALESAIKQYGAAFTDLVQGISVGSEDLYRITPTAQDNHENPGADPATIVKYIEQLRKQIYGTGLSSTPVGHVDTWTAWVNSSNQQVIDAVDWIGVDAYPNFQITMDNDISNASTLFFEALSYTKQAAGSKPVWITETGWPYSGKQMHDATPSIENSKRYWDDVGCNLFGQENVWWYDLYSPLFGILGDNVDNSPLYDLSCKNPKAAKSAKSTNVQVSSVASATDPSSGNSAAKVTGIPPPIPSGGGGYSAPSALNNTAGKSQGPTSQPVTSTMVIAYPSSSCKDEAGKTCTTSMVSATYLQIPHVSSPTPEAAPGTCGTGLVSGYLFPHLIVPLDRNQPNVPQGNSYNGNVSSTVSSVFNFDIPDFVENKTCSLVFLLPSGSQKPYTLNGSGGIVVKQVDKATGRTTYSDVVGKHPNATTLGNVKTVRKGTSSIVSKGNCSSIAGKTIGYLLSASGGTKSNLNLEWFQDSGAPAIGLYMNVC